MKPSSSRIDVDLTELDQIIDEGMRAPLSESNGQKLKTALHAPRRRRARYWRSPPARNPGRRNRPHRQDMAATTRPGFPAPTES